MVNGTNARDEPLLYRHGQSQPRVKNDQPRTFEGIAELEFLTVTH